ncbi:putative fatty acyl-CoA reductase CG5065 [Osmia lignaria lignaria]|uniref:putative fatty acyl-CoA reductase CG5065 n=1 Tax=Osmia lignaria lignaria TaxID=1437193 RepID=UPI00402B3234
MELLSFPIGQSKSMALSEWYADRELLLTGVTSDFGRALLEKILRSFPNVKVYTVLRSRNGLDKEDRIRNIFLSPRFERVRQELPDAISRVKAFEGNLVYDGLGTMKEDRKLLQNVSVVLHAGGPCQKLFEFCQKLPRLEVAAIVSSVFQQEGRTSEGSREEDVADVPVAFLRLPLIGPAYREPMPGFVDVLTGPTALIVGAGFALGKSQLRAEIIPIDLAVNSLIVSAWERATIKNVQETVVYNAIPVDCTWAELIKKGRRGNRKFTYPTFGLRGMTSIAGLHWILVLLFEWLPSAFCDTILSQLGAKKRLLEEQRRVRNALRSLESISSRSWSAERNRLYLLHQRLSSEEQDAFPVAAEIDVESYVLCATAAARKYCVDDSNIGIVKIFRLLFFLSIAVAFLSMFFFNKYRTSETVTRREIEQF